jgi:hypothetical protein
LDGTITAGSTQRRVETAAKLVLGYYESLGQMLAFHVNWLRSRGYRNTILYLPHDGVAALSVSTSNRNEDLPLPPHPRDPGISRKRRPIIFDRLPRRLA